MRISMIAARARNGVIGRDNGLPWRLPSDLRHFKALTLGKPVIMGRRTFESIGKPLPGRCNIVLSRSLKGGEGIRVARDMRTALDAARGTGADEAMIAGGAEIYREFLARADRLYLTEVHAEVEGDALFPEIEPGAWSESSREDHAAGPDTPAFSFVVLDRIG
ncbi:MAG TPA: dihydrofolate reductase [Arenibaculum sp.]|nr:dihydrofolate reductase [Arenibaculum sp.]